MGFLNKTFGLIPFVFNGFSFDQVLCRQTHIDEEVYSMLMDKAKEEGYDTSKLRKTQQTDPPPEGDGPVDTKGIWWIKALFGK